MSNEHIIVSLKCRHSNCNHSYISCVVSYCMFLFSVYHVKEGGWVKVSQTNVKDLYYQYKEEKDEL